MEFDFKVYYSLEKFVNDFEGNYRSYKENYTNASKHDFITHYGEVVNVWIDNVTVMVVDGFKEFIKVDFLGVGYIEEINGYVKNTDRSIDELKRRNLKYAFEKIKEYLLSEGDIEATSSDFDNKNQKPIFQTLSWQGSEIELVELIKGLIQAKKIIGVSEREIFEKFSMFFETSFNKKEKLQTIRQRTIELTPLLSSLEVAITNWINTKDN